MIIGNDLYLVGMISNSVKYKVGAKLLECTDKEIDEKREKLGLQPNQLNMIYK